MNRSIVLIIFSLTACDMKNHDTAFTPSNPIKIYLGDPFIYKDVDGTYYMTGTGGVDNGFKIYRSEDLIAWDDLGAAYMADTASSWPKKKFWAPEIHRFKDKYYMVFSADWKENPDNELENFRIGIAVSDKPEGPYADVTDQPIFDPGYPIIDANLLFEKDKIYLYYSRVCYKHPVESQVAEWAKNKGLFDEIEESWIYGVELKKDFSGVIGDPMLLLRPPIGINDPQTEWESRSVTEGEVNRRWTEGSYIFKQDGVYFMMYSANYFGGKNYAVGYATSSSPLGPFTKSPNNPVLEKNIDAGGIVTGTGHNSVTYSPDGKTMLCVYHGRTSATGDQRVVFIDSMKVDAENKLLTVFGPTTNENMN